MSNCAYSVIQRECQVSVEEFLRHCVDVPKFLSCCAQCPNFGKVWSCPPYDFNPEEVWKEYGVLHLYLRELRPLECTADELMEGFCREKQAFNEELLALEKAHPHSLALACGSCDACEVCRRMEGKPCAHPEMCRYSVESLGGDVSGCTERYFGKPVLWLQKSTLPEYMLLVGGLLRRKEE